MKQRKYIFLIFKLFSLGFGSLLLVAWGRGHRPETVAVSGTVLDPSSLTPLPGAVVSWQAQKATTDNSGHYEIKIPAGVRQISFAAGNRPLAHKIVILREAGSPITVDALFPESGQTLPAVLVLDRGSRLTQDGKELSSDIPADSTISLADQYGNADKLLSLNAGRYRVHSPVWLNASSIAFAKEGLLGDAKNANQLGVFEFQRASTTPLRQIASGIAARFLSRSPRGDALVIATYRELFVLDSIKNSTPPRRIFSLPPNGGFLLSVAWGTDDRIYFTIDDSVPLDDRHYLTRSRIASVKKDGTDLDRGWASDPDYSFRYPENAESGEIIFSRFNLDGRDQKLWSRNLRTGIVKPVAAPALHPVYIARKTDRLYYIYRQDLHLRDLKSGADWVIANSVEAADYLR